MCEWHRCSADRYYWVVPAPFGPITACNSPGATSNDTPSTAFSGPEWGEIRSRRRSAPVPAALSEAGPEKVVVVSHPRRIEYVRNLEG